MTDLLTIRDLHVRFAAPGGFIRAVTGASFRVRPRSTVALVGELGSGKSVVSQSIMRILPRNGEITRGEILFADPRGDGAVVDLASLPKDSAAMRTIRGGRISIIFQEPMTSLSPLHTVGNQVGEALRLHRPVGAAEATELTHETLRLVGFPDPRRALRSYPFELSGGLRQRAMIAMALVCRPALLIADEPTTALDVTIQAQILKLVLELQQELGMAVLLITHDLGVVANVAEEIVVMYRGEVVESGTLEDIFRRPEHPYLRALLRAVPRFDMKPGERLIPIREIAAGDAPHLMSERANWPSGPSAPLLECAGLRKAYSIRKSSWFGGGASARVLAVDGVSLKIERGECLGLVGESGCGKTTLAKVLLRAVTPDSGSVVFNDRGNRIDVLALEGDGLKRFRRQVQFIFQDPFGSLNPRMTVFDIIEEPLAIHGIGDGRSRREMVTELVALVGLDRHHLRRYPHSFSGRPAPAHRHCPRARLAPGLGDLRRTDLGARRLDPGANPEPLDGPQEKAGADLSVHFPQSGGRRLHRRPDRGYVRRPHRRDCRPRDVVPRPGAPLYAGAAGGCAGARSGASARLRPADGGQGFQPGGLAGTLPPQAGRSAAADRDRPWPRCRRAGGADIASLDGRFGSSVTERAPE